MVDVTDERDTRKIKAIFVAKKNEHLQIVVSRDDVE